MKKEAIWVDCSTVNPSFSLQAKEKSEQYGVKFMDAPVAGTKPQAENAALVFFVGAENTLLEKGETIPQFYGPKDCPHR